MLDKLLAAVHNEKLDKQDQVDQVLFEKVDRYMMTLSRELMQSRKDVRET